MIKAKHTPFHTWFFEKYSWWILNNHFENITFYPTEPISDKKSIVLVGNHFSWWDGFIALHLNRKFWKRKFHVMMLQDQLEKNMILRKAGAFSILKQGRSMLESINYAIQIAEDCKNIITIFPQGKIQSLYIERFRFENGWTRVLDKQKQKPQLVFYAALPDFLNTKKPHLYVFTQKVTETRTSNELADAYSDFYRQCKLKLSSQNTI